MQVPRLGVKSELQLSATATGIAMQDPSHICNLGVKSELQLQAYTTATGMQDPSHVCDLHHSNTGFPDPLSEARDQTCILIDTSF